ncbi:unnamed protein product [Albugo candida]|uniref:Uncharacterized protein n=1 Tax=Albugo candida TaxID=65357 RepID=A0A024GHD7_9STRA|nr:unnamed protein product [Albugo candida]|eukprot:CCI46308.1 unnamed protein product [Albugo candida]
MSTFYTALYKIQREYTSDDYTSGWMQRICNFSHLIVILYTMSSNNNSFFYPTPITQQLDSWSLAIVDLSYSVFAVMQMLMSHHDILNQKLRNQLCASTYTKVCSDAVGYSIKRIQNNFFDLLDTELNVQKIGESMRTIFSGFPDNPTPDSINLYVERVNRTIQRQVAQYAKHLDKWDDSAFRNYGGPYYHFINRFAEFFVLRCIHHLDRKHI